MYLKDLGQLENIYMYKKCRLYVLMRNMTNFGLVDTMNQSSTAGTPVAHPSQPLGNARVTTCQGLR